MDWIIEHAIARAEIDVKCFRKAWEHDCIRIQIEDFVILSEFWQKRNQEPEECQQREYAVLKLQDLWILKHVKELLSAFNQLDIEWL